jgi:putative phosphoribosyl transferase
MYFSSRMQAGRMLASQLAEKYRYDQCAVVCLSDGGVMVGAQIAMRLHSVLTMLLTIEIGLPRETQAIASMAAGGQFVYNSALSPGEVDELVGEYHGVIEQEKLIKLHELNAMSGTTGLIRHDLLENKVVILATDGLSSGSSLDIATEYLKPISIKRLVIATPLASVRAVDHMHIKTDEIYCLSVVEDYISTDHYYEVQDVPTHETVVQTISEIIGHWK